jgi:hypothetical protein
VSDEAPPLQPRRNAKPVRIVKWHIANGLTTVSPFALMLLLVVWGRSCDYVESWKTSRYWYTEGNGRAIVIGKGWLLIGYGWGPGPVRPLQNFGDEGVSVHGALERSKDGGAKTSEAYPLLLGGIRVDA